MKIKFFCSKFASVVVLLFAFVGAAAAQSPVFSPPNGSASISSSSPQTFNGPIGAPDSIFKGPRIDVRAFGAVGDGATNSCTALTAASNYALTVANSALYIPAGNSFATSCTVPFLTDWIVEGRLKAIAGGTAASTALISTGTSQTMTHKGIYGSGIIDGAGISPILVWLMQGNDLNVNVANMVGLAVNGIGVYLGDDAGVGAGGNGGDIYHVRFGAKFNTDPAHTGAKCVYISGGNGTQGAFTDDYVRDNILHDCAVGWEDHVGGNNFFVSNHEWDNPMTTCGDEFGNGGTLVDEYCDTPTVYGFHIRGLLTRIQGGTAYNGTLGNFDNVATAIQFDQSAEPLAIVTGVRIYGNDVTHRFAADTNLGFSTSLTTWCNMIEGNIVTIQQGATSCIQGAKFQVNTGSMQVKFGTFSMGQTNIACTSTCTFSSGTGTNIWVATLSQNATSTFVSPNPGDRIYTIMICQPPAGGPFTFTPPANSVGFGTIGTTASKCSVQEFVWDGTTLRASSTMQINE